jgi:hypothetical protein
MAELYKNEQLQILYDFGITPRRDVTPQLSELYKLRSSQIKEDITSNKISEIMAVHLNNITWPILGKTIHESVYTKNPDVYNQIGQLCHLYMGIHVPPKVAPELPPPKPEPKAEPAARLNPLSITTQGLLSAPKGVSGTSLNTPKPAPSSESAKSQPIAQSIITKGLRPPPPKGVSGTRLNGPKQQLPIAVTSSSIQPQKEQFQATLSTKKDSFDITVKGITLKFDKKHGLTEKSISNYLDLFIFENDNIIIISPIGSYISTTFFDSLINKEKFNITQKKIMFNTENIYYHFKPI